MKFHTSFRISLKKFKGIIQKYFELIAQNESSLFSFLLTNHFNCEQKVNSDH
jgi:hypothetical protein